MKFLYLFVVSTIAMILALIADSKLNGYSYILTIIVILSIRMFLTSPEARAVVTFKIPSKKICLTILIKELFIPTAVLLIAIYAVNTLSIDQTYTALIVLATAIFLAYERCDRDNIRRILLKDRIVKA